jgi:hypothetical protein
MKAGLLFDYSVRGTPNWEMIWVWRALVTSLAFSIEVGSVSFHPVKVSTKVRRYFCQYFTHVPEEAYE